MEKIEEIQELDLVTFLSFLTEEFKYNHYDDVFKEERLLQEATRLMNVVSENQESLTIPQIFALIYAYQNHSLWVRTGDHTSRITLFFTLLDDSPLGMARLLEFMLFESRNQAPTMTQWRKAVEEENLDMSEISPSIALDFINEDPGSLKMTERMREFRQFYKEVLL